MATATERRRRTELVQRAHREASAAEVFAGSSRRLRHLVPFDAAAWLGTDPGTGLPTSPVRIDGLDGVTRAMCATHWQHELLREDLNLFRSLARAPEPAAALRATAGDPRRSRRYGRFLRPLGLDDELRVVLRAGGAVWGTATLWRREGSPPFTRRDAALVGSLSTPIGEALRRHARPQAVAGGGGAPGGRHEPPGVLLFGPDDEVVSVDDGARAWLEALPPEPGTPTDAGVLPVWLLITVFRASAVRHGAGDGTARTRVRAADGRWVTCHASCLRQADGAYGPTVLVLEAAQPAAVAPLVAEAYDLSEREQQIVALIARGAATGAIASQLHLSPHTVRDHVKAIFAKAGVSSRGELTARLFAEFYAPLHAGDVVRVP